MKFYSENTKQFYDTEKECADADKKFVADKALKDAERERIARQKDADKQKIKEVSDEIKKLEKELCELQDEYSKKYGFEEVSLFDLLNCLFM